MGNKPAFMLDLQLAAAKLRLTDVGVTCGAARLLDPYYRHAHKAYEVHYIVSGGCELRVEEECVVLQEGDVCLIAPDLFHSQKIDAHLPFERITFAFEMLPLRKYDPADESAALAEALQSVDVFHCSARPMADLFVRLKEAALHCEVKIGGMAKLKAAAELIIIELAQRINTRNIESIAPTGSLDKRRIYLIDEFFHDHFHLNDGSMMLANRLGVTTRQLDRIIKSIYGKGFREKLLEMRLEVSKDLLFTTRKSIAEISELVGYASPANFSTFIKNMTGKTPTKIRNGKTDASPAMAVRG